MKRDSRIVYSTTDGDLRKARDPGLKERRADGNRVKDANNFGSRIGFNWANPQGNISVHGGYGIYYDRITLEVM